MGDFTLGCLLGQYDGAQSFDVASKALTTLVNSWIKFGPQSSAYFQSSAVHSSGQGIRCEAYSNATGQALLSYDHATANDLYARWSPDVTTHAIRYQGWVYADANSGVAVVLADEGPGVGFLVKYIPQGTQLSPYLAQTHIYSFTSLVGQNIYVVPGVTNSMAVYWDDVLTTIDPITLYPEWSFTEQARLIQARHRTLGGREHVYTWGKYFAYEVPLRFLSTSHAALINWWWSNQFHLLFTLDTSDSESNFIVRIANDRQPIGGRVKPYVDLWQGVLQLESVHDARLSF
ncbi:MAG: hypothetical protein OEW39_14650 [Deltaproteobacteria bacterium]|nr:hypothetical protein [Deltaproteobacteria bacterium]